MRDENYFLVHFLYDSLILISKRLFSILTMISITNIDKNNNVITKIKPLLGRCIISAHIMQ